MLVLEIGSIVADVEELMSLRFHGYCNAFRYDVERRKGQSSVGLGSNVAKSFVEIERDSTKAGL